jgi:hypothetical protein
MTYIHIYPYKNELLSWKWLNVVDLLSIGKLTVVIYSAMLEAQLLLKRCSEAEVAKISVSGQSITSGTYMPSYLYQGHCIHFEIRCSKD